MKLTHEQEDAIENRLDVLHEVLWHLSQSVALLKQPFATDEIALLDDLIHDFTLEQRRLENRLMGINDDL